MALAPGQELFLPTRACQATPRSHSSDPVGPEFLCPTPKLASHSRWHLRSNVGIYFLWERRAWE